MQESSKVSKKPLFHLAEASGGMPAERPFAGMVKHEKAFPVSTNAATADFRCDRVYDATTKDRGQARHQVKVRSLQKEHFAMPTPRIPCWR